MDSDDMWPPQWSLERLREIYTGASDEWLDVMRKRLAFYIAREGNMTDAPALPLKGGPDVECRHTEDRCCYKHQHHVEPHRGCILR